MQFSILTEANAGFVQLVANRTDCDQCDRGMPDSEVTGSAKRSCNVNVERLFSFCSRC